MGRPGSAGFPARATQWLCAFLGLALAADPGEARPPQSAHDADRKRVSEWVESFREYAVGRSQADELARRPPGPKQIEPLLQGLLDSAPPICGDDTCREAGALLHTEAAFLAELDGRSGDAHVLVDVARALLGVHEDQGPPKAQPDVSSKRAGFRHAWLAAVGRHELGNAHLAEAESLLDQAVLLAPTDADALTALGAVHDLAGSVTGLVEPPPEQAQPLLWRRSQMAGSLERAEQSYRAALQVDPMWHEARLRLARLLQERGEVDAAGPELARVSEQAEDATLRALAHLFLGQLAESRADPESAQDHYRTALRLSPGSQAMRLALSALLGSQGAQRQAIQLLADRWDYQVRGPNVWLAYRLGFPGRVSGEIDRLRAQVQRQ